MKPNFDTKKFMKDMNNIMDYSSGFLEGVSAGKRQFLDNLGKQTIEAMKEFVDSMARVDKEMLHHVYEWNQTGSPNSRLFDIDYTVSNLGLSLKSTFSQSVSIQNGSNTPFYDKARIMEYGIPVTIRPKAAKVLSFTDENGERVFTPNTVVVAKPGGDSVQGSFERSLDVFMSQYFTQSFLNASGIIDKLKDTSIYKKNLSSGAKMGRSRGKEIGYRWIVNAGIGR
jgi:hypothetical protein